MPFEKSRSASSLVDELQRDALDGNVAVSDLLRKAKVIAVKLALPEFEKWVEGELNGYSLNGDVPEYRVIRGKVKGRNPFHGWLPVNFGDPEMEDSFSKRMIFQKLAELEIAIEMSKDGQLSMPFSFNAIRVLNNATGQNSDFTLVVDRISIAGIVDAVRNALLDWSLRLENSGIRGEGMSFSDDDRKKAHETLAVYNIETIGTFTGNMGSGSGAFSVEGNVVNSASRTAIESLLRQIRDHEPQLDLKPEPSQELRQALNGLENEVKEPQPSSKRISAFLTVIRGIAEKAGGNLVAQGILHELSKLMQHGIGH